jgi:hypothetical protein
MEALTNTLESSTPVTITGLRCAGRIAHGIIERQRANQSLFKVMVGAQ